MCPTLDQFGDALGDKALNGLARMIVIPPEATDSVGVVAVCVWSSIGSRIIEGPVEDVGCVDNPHCSLDVVARELPESFADCFVEFVNVRHNSSLRCR